MKKAQFKKIFVVVIEPIAFGLLALLFIIPTITVVNLKPITKKLQNLDVLGISNKAELQITIVGGTHQIFDREKLQAEDGVYSYTTTLKRRESDRYSKPVLEIINNKEEETTLEIYGYTHLPTKSDITIIINDQVYRLQSSNGDVQTQEILLLPKQKYILYLAVENFSNVQFDEDFELKIKEI
jgi:hypothetical protein